MRPLGSRKKVRGAALNISNQRQRSSAGAAHIGVEAGKIADFIANQGHRTIQQIRDQYAAHSGRKIGSGFDFDDQGVGIDVEAAVIFTFAGDDADFATAIAIEHLAAEGFFQDFSFAGKQHLGADDHGVERNVVNIVGSAEFREQDSGLGIGHHRALADISGELST